MEVENQHLKLSKKGRRKMSAFHARGLLFDYEAGTLDRERAAALERCLETDSEVRADLERIRAGLQYARSLADTRVSGPVLEKIEEPETYLSVLLKKTNYDRWPLTIKWGIEAAVVLTVFLVVLTVIPWDQALRFGLSSRGREVILAEVTRPKDEVNDLQSTDTPIPYEDEPSEAPVAKAESPAPPSVPSTPPQTTPTSQTAVVPVVNERQAKPGEGALFRGTLAVTNLSAAGPKIKDKIVELGGRKAGEVELGWRKTPGSAYYHFTLPEAKYEELLQTLGDHGTPRIAKEKHPRVMPSGTIRLIITIDESK